MNTHDDKSDNKLYGKIGKLIKIVDDLRDLGLNEVFDLPKICVLGTQSSGKSSVLESIIGLDCLPRGSGLVTRRPLELRLVHMHYNDTSSPWAEFEEIKGEKFTDFNKVKEMIEKLTDEVAGSKGNIVNKPIKLRIYSKTCPDLTVIDLPGITRIPLHGSDQPDNIEEITKGMCELYCSDKSTIILCVIQANMDLSTSEALHMARILDPKGDRTIGVLTKVDLMDKGTDARRIINNEEVPLKNGFIAVKNRSQQDLIDRIPVSVAAQKEMLFFKSHQVYSKMNSSLFGIEHLVEKLRKLFFEHLKLFLPGIYQNLRSKIAECKKCLDELGSNDVAMLALSGNQLSFLNDLINKYTHNVEMVFAGKSTDMEENKIAHLLKIMYYEFLENLKEKPSEKIHNSYIMQIIIRSEGDRLSGFPESSVFHEILSEEYDIIKEDISMFYDKIYSMSSKSINNVMDKYFKFFPQLKVRIEELTNQFLEKSFGDTKYLCDSIVKANMEYLYIDETGAFRDLLNQILNVQSSKPTNENSAKQEESDKAENDKDKEKEKKQKEDLEKEKKKQELLNNKKANEINEDYNNRIAKYVKQIVDYYYDLTLRNLRESIPKALAHFYIKNMRNLRSFLLLELVNMQQDDLLAEDPLIANKRKYHYDIMKMLEKSEKLMLADDDIKKIIQFKKLENRPKLDDLQNQDSELFKRLDDRNNIIKKNAQGTKSDYFPNSSSNINQIKGQEKQSQEDKHNNASSFKLTQNEVKPKEKSETEKPVQQQQSKKGPDNGISVLKNETGTDIKINPTIKENGEIDAGLNGNISVQDAMKAGKFAAQTTSSAASKVEVKKTADPLSKIFGLKK